MKSSLQTCGVLLKHYSKSLCARGMNFAHFCHNREPTTLSKNSFSTRDSDCSTCFQQLSQRVNGGDLLHRREGVCSLSENLPSSPPTHKVCELGGRKANQEGLLWWAKYSQARTRQRRSSVRMYSRACLSVAAPR